LRFSSLLLLCLLLPINANAGTQYHPYRSRSTHHARYRRSAAARNAFKRAHPCPSTGMTKGACPGYVIDHINPLECGGADAPFNMQWQTIAEGKATDGSAIADYVEAALPTCTISLPASASYSNRSTSDSTIYRSSSMTIRKVKHCPETYLEGQGKSHPRTNRLSQ
jgi:hypothetical protein